MFKNIDKSNWQSFRFDQITSSITEKIDPTNTDLEIYVGLEHIDRESLQIKRFGKRDDVKGAKLRCYPGDIIFGKRRAYQRKAAVVDFDGFCSAHSLVLRANPETIEPNLFPLFLHSDLFMHRAIDISVGSLSPTINWGTLKKQEFLLPPKDQQAKIAELLWAMDDTIQRYQYLLDKLKLIYMIKIEEYVPRNYGQTIQLKDVVNIRKGVTYKSTDYSDINRGLPLLNLKSIERGGGFNKDGIKYFNGQYNDSHLVKNDDLIIACTDITRGGNVVGYPLHPSVYQNKKMLFTMDLAALEINGNNIMRDYLYYVFKSRWVHWSIFAWSPGTTVLHLNMEGFQKIKIPLLKKSEQNKCVQILHKFEHNIEFITNIISKSKHFQKSLINEIFSS